MNNYIYYNGELYHFGVKGMKWGVRKAKYDAKAAAYRKAAKATNNISRKNKLNKKADKMASKSAALDTKKGRVAYNVKKGAAITAGLLGAGLATYTAGRVVQQLARNKGYLEGYKDSKEMTKDLFKKNTGKDFDTIYEKMASKHVKKVWGRDAVKIIGSPFRYKEQFYYKD